MGFVIVWGLAELHKRCHKRLTGLQRASPRVIALGFKV